MFRHKATGFTLIEIILTLAILAIIIPTIFTFFFFNYNAVNKAQIEVELQSEGEKIIGEISDIAIQCSKMNLTTSDNNDKIDSVDDCIEFISNENHKFSLASDNKLLLDGAEFAQFIEYIFCTKVSNGVELYIKLKKRDIEKIINTTIYFRNAI